MKLLSYVKNRKKNPEAEDGSELVEFILLLPLFMFVIAIIISLAQLCYGGSVAVNAANTGCRAAIVENSRSKATVKADAAARRTVDGIGMGVTWQGSSLSVEGGGRWSRDHICLYSVTVNVKPIFPMAGVADTFSKTVQVTKTCPMMIERND